MISNPVLVLRKQGKLEEAFVLAKQNLQLNPEDMEEKLSLGWVYYDYLKRHALEIDFDAFIEVLANISDLELPKKPNLLIDSLAWPIRSLVDNLISKNKWNFIVADQLFNLIKPLCFTRPSETFSLLIRTLHHGFLKYNNYLEVMDWCTLDSFEAQDYVESHINGNKGMSIVEKIYINYAKSLLNKDSIIEIDNRKQRLQEFNIRLTKLIEQYPNYVYPAYYKAKILLELGQNTKALEAVLPFARSKANNFWVWELLANIYNDNAPYAFACYCKALSLGAKDEFLLRVRQDFCDLLIESKMYVEARTEIQHLLKVYHSQSLNTPQKVKYWMNQPWYTMVRGSDNNYILYKRYKGIAEKLLYQDIPVDVVVVEYVHYDKKLLHFIKNKNFSGFFKYDTFIKNPKIGEILDVRLQKEGDNGFYLANTVERSTQQSCEAIKSGHGVIRILANGLGFIGDVYFSQELLANNYITNESAITYKAFMVFNKKRQQWGWKAFEVSLLNTNVG